MTAVFEPKSYSQASSSPDWQQAMQEELSALKKTNTWRIMPLPPGKILIDCKWVYKVKFKADASVERLKALAKLTTMKFLLAIAAVKASDHSFFFKKDSSMFFGVVVYVDDMMVATDRPDMIEAFKIFLSRFFKFKDLGVPKYFLGLEIARNKGGILVSQRKYAMDLVRDAGLLGCKPSSVPMDPVNHLKQDTGHPMKDPSKYRRQIGRLLYLCITRPDITFVVHKLSQYVSEPCDEHWEATEKILRYLKGTPGHGLFYLSDSDFVLNIFSDADWATCPDTRRSMTCYCLFLGSSLVSWKAKKQHTISRSSAEAEYRAMAHATCEVVWARALLGDFGVRVERAVPLFCDNQAAVHISSNPVFHERTKHIEIDCHTVRERYLEGVIKPMHIRNDLQLADIFTKPLGVYAFGNILGKMNFHGLYCPS
ncbi:uncharacterized mitochondrial protein AtMg00810-like [Salvia splendens]|uniref:uncharacterized mitochondrial protein AtMg00810-like n=1 Tax=Salvia splendens TaxID=180675 RepID=UPI001C26C430|nr:uncharacterized mitochondrial protein AtMg00810-like [Salvia splendens]